MILDDHRFIPKPSSLGLLGKLWYCVVSFLTESTKKIISVAANPGDARVGGDEQSRDIPTLLAFSSHVRIRGPMRRPELPLACGLESLGRILPCNPSTHRFRLRSSHD